MLSNTVSHQIGSVRRTAWVALAVAPAGVIAVLAWRGIVSLGSPDPLSPQISHSAAVFDIAVLVLREGLECILVLAAITAGLSGDQQRYRCPIAVGAGIGLLATFISWCVAVRILDDISGKVSALELQAATGLLAIVVLLIVMNWFFHKLYWTGWISLHNRRKKELLEERHTHDSARRLVFGMGLLGFSSLYREGVEVVLFLQSYRLRLGNEPVYSGVILGSMLSGIVAVLTFIAHRKLFVAVVGDDVNVRRGVGHLRLDADKAAGNVPTIEHPIDRIPGEDVGNLLFGRKHDERRLQQPSADGRGRIRLRHRHGTGWSGFKMVGLSGMCGG